MNKYNLENGNTFPNHYVPNSVKNDFTYGRNVFYAILKATSAYREERARQVAEERTYARGEQDVKKHLETMNIDEKNLYVPISFTPTKIVQKFENVVVDDYQQLTEEPKATATAYHIQERKDKKRSDMKFQMDFEQDIAQMSQEVGFPIEDLINIPKDEDELDLILSLEPEEREELLMNEMLEFVLEDNDYEGIKKLFLSDIFQVQFGGIHNYTDSNGRIRIEFVPAENAIYDYSNKEMFEDSDYAGKRTTMNISTLRSLYSLEPEQEHLLHKLALQYRSLNGNDIYEGFSQAFNQTWKYSSSRPYDDFSVDVYHVWYKTVKQVGYTKGKDSYGKSIFDIDSKVEEFNRVESSKTWKEDGFNYVDTAYSGWFAGNEKCVVVLEWEEEKNQLRKGEEKNMVENPYTFFMPSNRGSMNVESAISRIKSKVNDIDLTEIKIKQLIAQHPPSGYAIDLDSLMEVDLGNGGVESPLGITDIYQQTGKLYYKGRSEDGVRQAPPITALSPDLINPLNALLLNYNRVMNDIRDTLGINPNREGTADLNRVSNTLAQTQIAISQTATYYIYRAYVKATEKVLSKVGTRIWNALKYGKENRGYLKYLGEQNIKFIKERDVITNSNYKYTLSLQMSNEDKANLEVSINACLSAGTLEMPDALMIRNIKDMDIAEKMLAYRVKKNKEELQKQAIQNSQQQAEATAQAGVAVEKEKQNTLQLQAQIDMEISKLREEGEKERALANVVSPIIKAMMETGAQIPPMLQPLVEAYIESHTIRQQKQQVEAEIAIAQEAQMMQQEQEMQQLQQGVQNGDITQYEAEEELQNQAQQGVI